MKKYYLLALSTICLCQVYAQSPQFTRVNAEFGGGVNFGGKLFPMVGVSTEVNDIGSTSGISLTFLLGWMNHKPKAAIN